MPPPRRESRAPLAGVEPELLPFLRDREEEELDGVPFTVTWPSGPDDRPEEGEIGREFMARLAAAWPRVRSAVLGDWRLRHDGRRPACWWLFDWNGELSYLERHRIEPPELDCNPVFGAQEMALWRPVRYEAWRRWRDVVESPPTRRPPPGPAGPRDVGKRGRS